MVTPRYWRVGGYIYRGYRTYSFNSIYITELNFRGTRTRSILVMARTRQKRGANPTKAKKRPPPQCRKSNGVGGGGRDDDDDDDDGVGGDEVGVVPPLYPDGTAVIKTFDDGRPYSGTVTRSRRGGVDDDSRLYYRVVYEDGDEEDMSEGEIGGCAAEAAAAEDRGAKKVESERAAAAPVKARGGRRFRPRLLPPSSI